MHIHKNKDVSKASAHYKLLTNTYSHTQFLIIYTDAHIFLTYTYADTQIFLGYINSRKHMACVHTQILLSDTYSFTHIAYL